MKHLICFIFSLCWASAYPLAAQQLPDSLAIGSMDYTLSRKYKSDFLNNKYLTLSHTLFFGREASIDRLKSDVAFGGVVRRTFDEEGNAMVITDSLLAERPSLKAVMEQKNSYPEVKVESSTDIAYREYASGMYYVLTTFQKAGVEERDTIGDQQWELHPDESKQIAGYEVRKATTHFRGRNYTAWYAPKIPIPAGPWKLGGLPGLILEAYDDVEEVIFSLTALNVPTQEAVLIKPPKTSVRMVDWPTFNAIRKKHTENINNMYRASIPLGAKPPKDYNRDVPALTLVSLEME